MSSLNVYLKYWSDKNSDNVSHEDISDVVNKYVENCFISYKNPYFSTEYLNHSNNAYNTSTSSSVDSGEFTYTITACKNINQYFLQKTKKFVVVEDYSYITNPNGGKSKNLHHTKH